MFSLLRRGAVLWLLCATGPAAFVACSGDEYKFVEEDAGPQGEGGADDPGDVTPRVCQSDEDCAGLAATGICDIVSGYCVECLPDREAELDRCAAGLYCDDTGRCSIGCSSPGDCGALVCDTESHLCTGCQSDADCSAGTRCENTMCMRGCMADETCPAGWLCCAGECRNPLTDAGHCGACAEACVGASECLNGLCGSPRCEPGTAECDGDTATICETNVRDDPENCGKCSVTCASAFCSGGTCTSVDCPSGFADCNGEEADRCETDLSTIEDCGSCGVRCSDVNGEASCTARGCVIACSDGYDDCDDDVATGCEARLATDASHCGSCGNECTNEHGSTRCTDGECSPRCDGGFGDCDGDPANGCETDLTTSLSHCGACGERCAPAHAEGVCEDGVCTAECDADYDDCNGYAADGCEADLTTPETCGACTNHCIENGGTASCGADGTCLIDCDDGRSDCVNGVADGCETNTSVNTQHCGTCERVCPSTMGTPACLDGTCGISTCTDPYQNCVQDDSVDCETNVTNDFAHCGRCDNSCFVPNGTAVCRASECEFTGCTTGFADCSEDVLGCETQLGTRDNCRDCADCANEHGTHACTADGCVPTCSIGWADCDGNPNNGCETSTTTLTDCGGCDMGCSFPNATASCATGTCTLIGCAAGYGDCGAGAGCETPLGNGTNCAACGNRCTNDHGMNTCQPAGSSFDCSPTCSAGYDDCDDNPDNGCEASLASTSDCGVCGRVCTGATPYCRNGGCTATPPGLCSSGTFALCDDFEDQNANGWMTTGGTWSIGSDPSYVYVGGVGSYRATNGQTSWTNQTIQARMKILHFDSSSSSYRAGILARFGGSTNYYAFQVDGAGDLRLLQGTSTVSGTGTCATIASSLAVGTWYTLKLQVSGPASATRLVSSYSTNGTTFTPAHDCTLSGAFASGSAGVLTVGANTNAEFDDFAVTTP